MEYDMRRAGVRRVRGIEPSDIALHARQEGRKSGRRRNAAHASDRQLPVSTRTEKQLSSSQLSQGLRADELTKRPERIGREPPRKTGV